MEYLRKVDFARFSAATGHINQTLLDAESGGTTTRIQVVQGPKGTGSRRGLHTHTFDQVHYVIKGTLFMEIGDFKGEAPPGTLVYIPAGTPHRNTTSSDEPAFFFNVLAPLSAWTPDGKEPA